jgi:hypothetical protein
MASFKVDNGAINNNEDSEIVDDESLSDDVDDELDESFVNL